MSDFLRKRIALASTQAFFVLFVLAITPFAAVAEQAKGLHFGTGTIVMLVFGGLVIGAAIVLAISGVVYVVLSGLGRPRKFLSVFVTSYVGFFIGMLVIAGTDPGRSLFILTVIPLLGAVAGFYMGPLKNR